MTKPKFIMIHHTAVSYLLNYDQFEANNRYHKEKFLMKSSMGFYLAYNYEISMQGYRRQARADGETTAACYQAGLNDGRCVHIALDGNFDIQKPTDLQIYALRDLLRLLNKRYNIFPSNIIFHSKFAPKTCPGKNMSLKFIQSLM